MPKTQVEKIIQLRTLASNELALAIEKFPSFNSAHEGYAVIKEEVDELWELVKANKGRSVQAEREALQIAAMALRFVLDLRR